MCRRVVVVSVQSSGNDFTSCPMTSELKFWMALAGSGAELAGALLR